MIAESQTITRGEHVPLAESSRPALRIGLMIDSYRVPRWRYQIICDILASSFAQVVLIIKNAGQGAREPSILERARVILKEKQYLLYKIYSRLDGRVSKETPDALEQVSIEPLIGTIPVIEVKPLSKNFSDELREEDTSEINKYQLDVALRFGFRILKGSVLRIARHGVWSYHHGDNLRYRGGPPGFWEVMQGDPATGAVLQILSEELDNGQIIYRAHAQTDPWSVSRNANNCFWQSSPFVMRKLRDLYLEGRCALTDPLQPAAAPYSRPLYRIPTTGPMCRMVAGLTAKYLCSKVRNLFYFRQWFMAYRIGTQSGCLDETFYRFKRLVPPKGCFWADPFPFKREGKHYIFFEELPYSTGKGHLAVVQVDSKGIVAGPHKILDRPYHLSYPFLFEWQNELYMIPETSKARTVELYRCVSFPDRWELDRVLLDNLRAVDTTLAQIDGRWWMFTGIEVERTKSLYELHLFYAESPSGPWQPHKANPVRPDCQTSRPAGGIVRRDGVYYRPAQLGVGDALVLYRIDRLDPDAYRETEIGRILPEWAEGLIGTHTLNSVDELSVIDALRYRRRYL